MLNNTTPEVQEIGQMNFEGNIIPKSWYQHIKFANGKTDAISVLLLSEIVYWYRPTTIYDENTGAIIEIKKKFKSDALQRSQDSLAEQFGFTKEQIKDSLVRLEKLGLITRDYRTIGVGSKKLANVLFIKIHPLRIKEISSFIFNREGVSGTIPIPSGEQSPYPPGINPHTNTKNKTQTSSSVFKVNDGAKPSLTPKKQKEKSLFKPKVKFSEEQIDIFNWLLSLDINTSPDTLSWWARNYSLERLENVYREAMNRKAKSPGAYMQKLLKEKCVIVTGNVKENAEFAKDFKESNAWGSLEIHQKYAIINHGNKKIEVNFNQNPKEFAQDLIEKYKVYK